MTQSLSGYAHCYVVATNEPAPGLVSPIDVLPLLVTVEPIGIAEEKLF